MRVCDTLAHSGDSLAKGRRDFPPKADPSKSLLPLSQTRISSFIGDLLRYTFGWVYGVK